MSEVRTSHDEDRETMEKHPTPWVENDDGWGSVDITDATGERICELQKKAQSCASIIVRAVNNLLPMRDKIQVIDDFLNDMDRMVMELGITKSADSDIFRWVENLEEDLLERRKREEMKK